MTRGLGVDPGLANTGIAAIERLEDGRLYSRGVRCAVTTKNDEKEFRHVRATVDDERRIREMWTQIEESVRLFQPHVIGVEVYTIYEASDAQETRAAAEDLLGFMGLTQSAGHALPTSAVEFLAWLTKNFDSFFAKLIQLRNAVRSKSTIAGRGQAAKTMLVYGATLAVAYQYHIPVFCFVPTDRTIRLGGRRSASKQEVAQGVAQLVEGLDTMVHARIKATTKREHVYDAAGLCVLGIEEFERQRQLFTTT